MFFSGYGDDDVTVILDHYKAVLQANGVDVSEAELEWNMLKKEIYSW